MKVQPSVTVMRPPVSALNDATAAAMLRSPSGAS